MHGLSEIAEREIRSLRKAGFEPSLQEIVWLNELGLKAETPSLVIRKAAGAPVRCGGVWLWPFTCQGGEWYDKHATRLFTSDDMLAYSLGFALALGREYPLPRYCLPWLSRRRVDEITFAHLTEYGPARHAVNAWILRSPFTLGELRASIVALMPQLKAPHVLPKPPQAKDDPDRLPILSELAAGTGKSREYWQTQLSDVAYETLNCLYKQLAAAEGADTSELARAAALDANCEFMAAVEVVKKKHKGASDAG